MRTWTEFYDNKFNAESTLVKLQRKVASEITDKEIEKGIDLIKKAMESSNEN